MKFKRSGDAKKVNARINEDEELLKTSKQVPMHDACGLWARLREDQQKLQGELALARILPSRRWED